MEGFDKTQYAPGTKVCHFKRELLPPAELVTEPQMYLYEIIGIGTHTETEEDCMVYRALYGDHKLYIRPLSMFLSPVDKAKYPTVRQTCRFAPFSEAAY